MNNYNFDEEFNRIGSNCFKWDGRKKFLGNENLIPMHIADMDFKCAPEILEEIEKRAKHPFFGYTIYSGSHFECMAEWLHRRHNWKVLSNNCLYSPSVVTSLSIIIFSLTNENDGVIVQTPIYPPFMEVVRNNNRKLLINELKLNEQGNYSFDFDNFEDLCKKNAPKILLFCNPHNPIGKVWEKHELLKVAELCKKYNIIVVSDEIHSDIVYKPKKHVPFASLGKDIAELTLTCTSPAKTFNLPSISSSVIIVENNNYKKILDKALDRFHLFLPSAFSVLSFEAAYKYGEKWYNSLMEYLLINREVVFNWANKNNKFIQHVSPDGTYLAWISFKNLNLKDIELKKLIYENANVALDPGTRFGKGGEGFMRLNFACPLNQLNRALEKIEMVFK
nr:pyridoxal phosphate-dependent aminotransferase [Pigmentibacter ruber]